MFGLGRGYLKFAGGGTGDQVAEVHRLEIARLEVWRVGIGDVLRQDLLALDKPRHAVHHRLEKGDRLEVHLRVTDSEVATFGGHSAVNLIKKM